MLQHARPLRGPGGTCHASLLQLTHLVRRVRQRGLVRVRRLARRLRRRQQLIQALLTATAMGQDGSGASPDDQRSCALLTATAMGQAPLDGLSSLHCTWLGQAPLMASGWPLAPGFH